MENELRYKVAKPKLFLLVSGLLIAAWSIGTFFGWFLYDQSPDEVISWSRFTPLNTCILFFLCSFSLIAISFDIFFVANVLGGIIALYSTLMIFQDISNGSLSLWGESNFPGKMAVNSALCFLLSGIIFWGIGGESKNKTKSIILSVIGSIIIALGMLSFIGYLSGVQAAYVWSNQLGMSATADIGFIIIGLCGVFYNLMQVKKPFNDSFLLSLPLCIGILTLTFGFSAVLWAEQKNNLKTAEILEGTRLKENVLKDLKASTNSFEHMVRVWTLIRPSPKQLWEEEAKLLLSQIPGLVEVVWVNAGDKVEWVAGGGAFKTEIHLNEKMLEKAKDTHSYAASGIYDDEGRLVGMSIYNPIYFDDQNFDGYLVGVFDIKKFIQSSLSKEQSPMYRVGLIHGGNSVIPSSSVWTPGTGSLIPISLFGLQLDVFVEALDVLGRESYLPGVIMLCGMLTAFFIALLLYIALGAKESAEGREKTLMQLQRAHDTIIEQDKLVSLGMLTAGIAHEVKNPLNIMRCFSELSQSLVEEISHTFNKYKKEFSPEDSERINESIGTLGVNLIRIEEQSKRANNTIQRMLAHSRGGQYFVLTDMHALLDEYLNLSYYGLRVQDPTLNIKISKRYDVSAPKINIVAEDMSRVFLNLFNNAYYAMAQRKKKEGASFVPELIITTTNIRDHFEIRIRDNGMGIPESVRDKIFTPFFTTKPVGAGTGLGLSLSLAIVDEHGGVLDFVSKEGEFTEFHITLPVKPNKSQMLQWELAGKK